MSVQNYLDKMKSIQKSILNYIENDSNSEENFQNLIKLLNEQNIKDNTRELKSLFHLIVKIVNCHHHNPDFFNKIDRIINHYKDDIKSRLSNTQIFTIFKSSKRILLFLIKEKILNVDKFVTTTMSKDKHKKYKNYFSPEIKNQAISELPDDFEDKRKNGENDSDICELIRKDSIDEFVDYVTKNKFEIKKKNEKSIFETNTFIIKNQPTLIEYTAFFGSIKILKYLFENKIEFTPKLWLYAIHGNNLELIHFLEENHIEPEDKTYEKCLIEAIKCHHNVIANYILSNLFKKEIKESTVVMSRILQYYNFEFMQIDMINQSSLYDLCRYDYDLLFYILLGSMDVDINLLYIHQ